MTPCQGGIAVFRAKGRPRDPMPRGSRTDPCKGAVRGPMPRGRRAQGGVGYMALPGPTGYVVARGSGKEWWREVLRR